MLYNLSTMHIICNRDRIQQSSKSTRYGAVLVEFTVVSLFLLIMLFGIIQYSIILTSLNTMQQITREGARYYAVHYADGQGTDNNETINYMQSVASGSFIANSLISNSTVNINAVPSNGTIAADNPVQVSFTYNMAQCTFFGGFVPGVKAGTNNVTKSTVTIIEH